MKTSSGSTRSRAPIRALGTIPAIIALFLGARSAVADTLIPPSMQPFAQLTHFVFSSWAKNCQDTPQENALQVCFTGKNGRTDSGSSFVAAVLIDAGNEREKILRVTLPLGMRIADGTWISIDQGQPTKAPYIICINLGCIADYEASRELINLLMHGKDLMIGAVNAEGQLVNVAMPLVDFPEAYGGPPAESHLLQDQ